MSLQSWGPCGGASVQGFLLRGLLKSQGTSIGEPPEQGWKDRISGKSLTPICIYLLLPVSAPVVPAHPHVKEELRGGQNPLHAGAWARGEPFSQTASPPCLVGAWQPICWLLRQHLWKATLFLQPLQNPPQPGDFEHPWRSPSELTKKNNPCGGPNSQKGKTDKSKQSHAQQRELKKEKPMGREVTRAAEEDLCAGPKGLSGAER